MTFPIELVSFILSAVFAVYIAVKTDKKYKKSYSRNRLGQFSVTHQEPEWIIGPDRL